MKCLDASFPVLCTHRDVAARLAGLDKVLPDPWAPRANSVPSRERSEGHYATPPGRTPLQQVRW